MLHALGKHMLKVSINMLHVVICHILAEIIVSEEASTYMDRVMFKARAPGFVGNDVLGRRCAHDFVGEDVEYDTTLCGHRHDDLISAVDPRIQYSVR
jgi:hypothetical protein